MPKRIKDKNKSIFVKFNDEIDDKKINEFLNSLGIYGTRVSSLINRWAVEIPFWREGHFTEKMLESDLVNTVHENFNLKRKNRFEEQGEYDE
jgi:hypothetical protein